jgi:hypothetical protein
LRIKGQAHGPLRCAGLLRAPQPLPGITLTNNPTKTHNETVFY